MGSLVITIPDFAEHQLVFDAQETKQILNFFWPHAQSRIGAIEHVTFDQRRLAQTGLVAAIEGSYAMGVIDITTRVVGRNPIANVSRWGRTLAHKLAGYVWRHATRADLASAEVYDTLRKSVARNLVRHLDLGLQGASLHRGFMHLHVQSPSSARHAA